MMNRRGFIGVVGSVIGFLGFAKLSNNANESNPKNLPVMKFNDDDGCCCNYEEIFKGMPFSKVGVKEERERHVWVMQEDSVCLNKDGRSYKVWGEVNMVDRKSVGYMYSHFKACPQSFKTALNRCHQLPYVLSTTN